MFVFLYFFLALPLSLCLMCYLVVSFVRSVFRSFFRVCSVSYFCPSFCIYVVCSSFMYFGRSFFISLCRYFFTPLVIYVCR